MKLSRTKIAKLLKMGNQSRKNKRSTQSSSTQSNSTQSNKRSNNKRSKSLGVMDKNEIVWMDDEMPLNKKRRAYSAHKRKPYNLRLKSLKKWRQRGGFEWSGYKELLKTKTSDEVLQKLEADYASNKDALDQDDEFKQWLLAFQSGDATGNKKKDLLKLIEGKEKANKQALAEESKKLSPEGKAAAAKAEA